MDDEVNVRVSVNNSANPAPTSKSIFKHNCVMICHCCFKMSLDNLFVDNLRFLIPIHLFYSIGLFLRILYMNDNSQPINTFTKHSWVLNEFRTIRVWFEYPNGLPFFLLAPPYNVRPWHGHPFHPSSDWMDMNRAATKRSSVSIFTESDVTQSPVLASFVQVLKASSPRHWRKVFWKRGC